MSITERWFCSDVVLYISSNQVTHKSPTVFLQCAVGCDTMYTPRLGELDGGSGNIAAKLTSTEESGDLQSSQRRGKYVSVVLQSVARYLSCESSHSRCNNVIIIA